MEAQTVAGGGSTICSFFRKGKCKDGERCRFRHARPLLPLDDPRGDKLRYDGGGQGSLEVMNVPDPRNSKAPLQGTDDRRPISARINASSVGDSGGVTKENNVDSRLRYKKLHIMM